MSSYVAKNPIVNRSERVFLNGQLQTPDTDDYVRGGQLITTARPAMESEIAGVHPGFIIDYTFDGLQVRDYTGFIMRVLANEVANGSRVDFTFGDPAPAENGTLGVYVNGQHMVLNTDYTKGAAASVTFVAAPPPGAVILARYFISGNEWSEVVDEFHTIEKHAIAVSDTDVMFTATSKTDPWDGIVYYPKFCECYINGSRNDGYTKLYDGSGNWNGLQFGAFRHPAVAFLYIFYRY